MNEEQTAISNTVEQWTPLAETGEIKSFLLGILHSCYLCQYAYEKSGGKDWPERCKVCPYYKKYGYCNNSGSIFMQWHFSKKKDDRQRHAAAFLAQVKTLQEKPMDKKEIEQEIEFYEKVRIRAEKAVAKLKAQLEKPEPEKPKLRNFDVGLFYFESEMDDKDSLNGIKAIYIEDGDTVYFTSKTHTGSVCCSKVSSKANNRHLDVMFNLADDLAALSELLEEFEIKEDSVKVYIQDEDCLVMKDERDNKAVYISPGNIHDFILNLRKLEIKMIADAAKQKAK